MNAEMNPNYQLINAKAVAKMLSTSVRTIWRYRSSGAIPKPMTIGSSIRWKLSDIKLFLECDGDMKRFIAMREVEK